MQVQNVAMTSLAAPVARRGPLAACSVAVTVVGYAAAVVAVALVLRDGAAWMLGPVVLPLSWLVAASLAVRARPDHPSALLFVGLGAAHLVGLALGLPLSLDRSLAGWGAWAVDLVSLLAFGLGFAALGAFLATYPRGRPSTSAERWFVRLVVPLVVIGVLLETTTRARVALVLEADRSSMPAPTGLPLVDLSLPVYDALPLLVVVGTALLVVRGRRTVGEERRQLTWAAGAGGLLALMLLMSPVFAVLAPPAVGTAVFLVVAAVIPFVLLAGLVRFRLMQVDVYVTRTLASGTVVAIVLAAYALVAAVTADNRAATAGVVVLAALTGVPLLRLASRAVDRWFSGGRVRGQALLRELADTFSASESEDIARRTVRGVADGLDVAWVRLVAGELEETARPARAPAGVTGSAVGRATDSGEGPFAEPELSLPLLAGTETVGRLECGPRHGGWSATEVAEVELLAHHAALALHNAELSTRLAAQVEELHASRLRIVRAELDVRRGLERDLHDGVQQQVVALIAHLGALRVLVAADTPASEVIDTARRQAGLCLTDLRALISGVHPPVLLDRGVVAAVESRAALLPLPVHVQSQLDRRYPEETEATAYYVVSEALTNVVKHAGAAQASVCFEPGPGGGLRVVVCDDGLGMDQHQLAHGLSSLRDRTEALGGELTVESGPGGTRVDALLPVTEGGLHA